MKKFFLVLILPAVLMTNGFTQYMSSPKLSGVGLPFFQAGIFRTFDDAGENRIVRLYFQIINDDLTFIKKDDVFEAEVQFDIYINNQQKEFVVNRSISKVIKTTHFDETNSRKVSNSYTTDISLPPNVYDAVITALDKNSNKQVNRKIHFELEDISSKEFLLSDLLFFKDYQKDSLGNISNFEPNLTNNFSGEDKYFYFYLSSIIEKPQDTLNIKYTIRNTSGAVTQMNEYSIIKNERKTDHYIRINRQQFDQSRYELEVTGSYRGNSITMKKTFSFFWTESPQSPQDLDKALEQMRYLLEADSVGWALKQPYEIKKAYFDRFWNGMDPNKETQKNELMDEYYLRVNFANQNYSTLSIDGWLTDRGRIFIKFGQPDDIERHPFEIDSVPYEIWRYYSVRKIFVFVDRTGFGDYYLHPDYIDQEFN
jgi:GWxTD domain-containing protein